MAFFNFPMSLCHLPISPGTHKYLELHCLEGSGEKPFQNMSPLAALESLTSDLPVCVTPELLGERFFPLINLEN